jgi:hypothetical protein
MGRPRIVGLRFAAAAFVLAAATIPAAAQDISVTFGSGTGLTERMLQLVALVTVLSLAPSILIMVTSFTRIVVVLSLLRTALGTATAPLNAVIISLALFLTAFVMGPVFQGAWVGRASERVSGWPEVLSFSFEGGILRRSSRNPLAWAQPRAGRPFFSARTTEGPRWPASQQRL